MENIVKSKIAIHIKIHINLIFNRQVQKSFFGLLTHNCFETVIYI